MVSKQGVQDVQMRERQVRKVVHLAHANDTLLEGLVLFHFLAKAEHLLNLCPET